MLCEFSLALWFREQLNLIELMYVTYKSHTGRRSLRLGELDSIKLTPSHALSNLFFHPARVSLPLPTPVTPEAGHL